jgi:hypothetical protein
VKYSGASDSFQIPRASSIEVVYRTTSYILGTTKSSDPERLRRNTASKLPRKKQSLSRAGSKLTREKMMRNQDRNAWGTVILNHAKAPTVHRMYCTLSNLRLKKYRYEYAVRLWKIHNPTVMKWGQSFNGLWTLVPPSPECQLLLSGVFAQKISVVSRNFGAR